MKATPIALSYGRQATFRRRLLRRGATLIALVALVWVGWIWAPAACKKAQVMYWQEKCLRYSPPADLVVYEEDPTRTPPLALSGGDYTPVGIWSPKEVPLQVASHCPHCLYKLSTALSPNQSSTPLPVIFMHERRSPSGRRFLITLYCDASPPDVYGGGFVISPGIMQPETWTTSAQPGSEISPGQFEAPIRAPRAMRIFAGQADPLDSTHLTIRYEIDGRQEILDGYVADSISFPGCARVTFKPRGPAQSTAPKPPEPFPVE